MTPLHTLVIATTNAYKGTEMVQILAPALPGISLRTLAEFPGAPSVEETASTFSENALLKARSAAEFTGLPALADDGGLIIDALGGKPGVHSHRFLGAETPFDDKMRAILERMHGLPDRERTCRFQCAVAIVLPDGQTSLCEGGCEGRIAHAPRGAYGFGYDPIFFLPELGLHMAELPPEEKQRISHRGKALGCAIAILRSLAQEQVSNLTPTANSGRESSRRAGPP